MPWNSVRKTQRKSYGSDVLAAALHEIEAGVSVNHVSHKYHIDRRTLRRHRDGKVSTTSKVVLGRFEPEFNSAKMMESLLFGLTVMDVCWLPYNLAKHLGLPHRFNPHARVVCKTDCLGFWNATYPYLLPQSCQPIMSCWFQQATGRQVLHMLQNGSGIFNLQHKLNMEHGGNWAFVCPKTGRYPCGEGGGESCEENDKNITISVQQGISFPLMPSTWPLRLAFTWSCFLHKLKPCVKSFFKPFKSAYNAAADNWMVSHLA